MRPSPSVSHILESVTFEETLPIEFPGGFRIRKATDEETEKIQKEISRFDSRIRSARLDYETRAIRTPMPNGTSFSYDARPRSEWLYHVLESPDYRQTQELLEDLMMLCTPSLPLGVHWMQLFLGEEPSSGRGMATHDGQIAAFFQGRNGPIDPILVTKGETQLLREHIQNELRSPRHPLISQAFQSLKSTRVLPVASDAEALAYFGLIELLLTHRPTDSDTIDSISRQLRNKVKLLQRFFARSVEASAYFQGAEASDVKALWKRLYAYRSSLAHGDSPNFAKEFSSLKDRSTVSTYLRELTKVIMIHWLRQPEFMSDLRDC